MRHNLPITNREHFMDDDEIIVSTTDLKGRIISVNDAFIHISGFTNEELVGQPHNVVRHPDMPDSAFQNLWDTLEAAEPWTGVVKNRCKNGDYYWVVANVTPIVENGQVTSYLSVRTKPTPEQIQAASALYADVNAGKTSLGKTSLLKKLNIFNKLKVWQEIVGVILVSILMFGAALYETSTALKTANDGLAMSNSDRNVALTAAKSDGILQFEKTLLLKTLAQDPVPFSDNIEIIENDIVSLNENLEVINSADLGVDEREAADAFAQEVGIYIDEVLKPSIRAMQQADRVALKVLLQEKIIQVDYDASSQALLALQVQLQAVSEEEYEVATTEVARVEQLALILVILALIIVTILAWHVTSTLRKRMDYAVKMLGRVSEGHYFDWVEVDEHDEIGAMLLALKSMQIRQGYRMTEVETKASAALRIKSALDVADTNVMLADADYNIVYLNASLEAMLNQHAVALKSALPNLDLKALIGTNIDVFHKDPAHQRRILDALKEPYTSGDLDINGFVVRIRVTPVFNSAGERVAITSEWEDRTAQLKVEGELESFMKAVVNGDLSQRMNATDKQGFFLTISNLLNRLGEVLEGVFADTNAALAAMEKSDLTHRINTEYVGSYDEVKQAVNNTAEKLADIMHDMRSSAMNVADGSSEISNGNATLSDRTQEQAASLEETSASIEEITGTVQQNADNARQANQLAVSTCEQAQKGSEVASQAVEAMSGISSSSKKISDIIGVIDEIAFQTNLLALNAAVEAARAGEQGRGFAVVAGEVRTLAGRSAEAAKEIKGLINASVESVAHGSKLVDDSGAALSDIVVSVQKVTDIIAEIAAASQEQSAGIDQVNKAITQLDSAVQQNAALVEETAASSANMDQEAGEMLALVDGFNTGKQLGAQKTRKPTAVKKAPAYKASAKPQAQKSAVKSSPKRSKAAVTPAAAASDDVWEEF